jgi:hypothetical protein
MYLGLILYIVRHNSNKNKETINVTMTHKSHFSYIRKEKFDTIIVIVYSIVNFCLLVRLFLSTESEKESVIICNQDMFIIVMGKIAKKLSYTI